MSATRQTWRMALIDLHGKLLRAREALGLKQVDVAARIGVSPRTFQRFESGEGDASTTELFRWADAVGITITSADIGAPVLEEAA